LKACNRCKTQRTFEFFNKNPSSPDGYYSLCKDCRGIQKAEYRQRPEVIAREKARLAKAYADNRDALLAKRKARYAADKPKALSKNREWREANLEQHRALCRQWAKDHPEAMRAISAKRRALKNGAEGAYTADDVAEMLASQEGKCNACQAPLAAFHVDHKRPLSRGGSNWPSNLQLLCPPCNLSKGDKTPDEWAAYKEAA
jgi:5-methylcytosine-specific restriction endonuclease McrA